MTGLKLCFVFALLLVASSAEARPLNVEILRDIPVYAKPEATAKPIGKFKAGATLLVSDKTENGWRRVRYSFRGKAKHAWVRVKDIENSLPAPSLGPAKNTKYIYKRSKGIGLAVVGSNITQQGRSLTLNDQVSIYEISSFSGTSFWFSVFFDASINSTWGLRTYGIYRQVQLTGDSRLKGVGGAPDTLDELKIEQTYLGIAATLKFYPALSSNFWFGGGLEVAKNTAIKISSGGGQLAVSEEDKPMFFYPHLSLGWDYSLSDVLYFVPELKLGYVTSLKPKATALEAHLGFAYRF